VERAASARGADKWDSRWSAHSRRHQIHSNVRCPHDSA
jgi:hypothetical protein